MPPKKRGETRGNTKDKGDTHRETMVVAGMTGADTTITSLLLTRQHHQRQMAMEPRDTLSCMAGRWQGRDSGPVLRPADVGGSSSHAWTEKEELADLVDGKVRSDLIINNEGSSRLYDEGGMEDDDNGNDIVSKSRKSEK